MKIFVGERVRKVARLGSGPFLFAEGPEVILGEFSMSLFGEV